MRTVLQDSGSAACAATVLAATKALARRILRTIMIRSLPRSCLCHDPESFPARSVRRRVLRRIDPIRRSMPGSNSGAPERADYPRGDRVAKFILVDQPT